MTEAEWLSCADPDQMVDALDNLGMISQRKLRLFAVACCQRIVHLCPGRIAFEVALETAELFADELRPEQDLIDADSALVAIEQRTEDDDALNTDDARYHAMQATGQAVCLDSTECPYHHRMRDVVLHTANAVAFAAVAELDNEGTWEQVERTERRALANLWREIFGYAHRAIAIVPAWRTRDVKLLARGIYEEKAFDRMPILADALQDAGCDNTEILEHCRGPDPHVRGCWVVDLILGKQ